MFFFITARKRTLGQGNFFTPVVILFTGGGLPDRVLDRDPPWTETSWTEISILDRDPLLR